jgi:hypothetical protein
MDQTTLIVCGVGVAVVAYAAGYLFARLDAVYVLLRSLHGVADVLDGGGPRSRSMPQKKKKEWTTADDNDAVETVSIDERKFVTKIDTAGMLRGSAANIGVTTTTADTINESVSKLSQLKGR